jgi:hypothetical protein
MMHKLGSFWTTTRERFEALDRFHSAGRCAWPLGEVDLPDFRFCREPVALFSGSYCEEHHRLAWVKPRVRGKSSPRGVVWASWIK